jgi:tRNA G18 (ribose-2'-O)-methylase SpoU
VTRGFFAVGVYHPKTAVNIGTLLRTAYLYDAAFVFTVGRRYKVQASDTPNTTRHIPLFHFETVDDLISHLPDSTPLVGVELDPRAIPLHEYEHPIRAAYLMGAEDHGLPQHVIDRCHDLVVLDSPQPQSMNVSVAGSIVIYDRHAKQLTKVPVPQ